MKPNEKGKQEAEEAWKEVVCVEICAADPGSDDAMERLRSAAEEQLRQNADKIATAQGTKAASGDLSSAKFLVDVIKRQARAGRWRRRTEPSEALRLASQPPWKEPSAESPDVKAPEEPAPDGAVPQS